MPMGSITLLPGGKLWGPWKKSVARFGILQSVVLTLSLVTAIANFEAVLIFLIALSVKMSNLRYHMCIERVPFSHGQFGTAKEALWTKVWMRPSLVQGITWVWGLFALGLSVLPRVKGWYSFCNTTHFCSRFTASPVVIMVPCMLPEHLFVMYTPMFPRAIGSVKSLWSEMLPQNKRVY